MDQETQETRLIKLFANDIMHTENADLLLALSIRNVSNLAERSDVPVRVIANTLQNEGARLHILADEQESGQDDKKNPYPVPLT